MARKVKNFYYNNPTLACFIAALMGPVTVISAYCVMGGGFR